MISLHSDGVEYPQYMLTCFSVRMTLPSNWSSNPFIVTVKSMMAVFALISGVYEGLGSFVVI